MGEPRVIITGASGFLGGLLVPRIAGAGYELLLVGRDPAALAQAFPGHDCCGYDQMAERGAGAQALLHLATQNSDAAGDTASFMQANVTLLRAVLEAARAAGVRQVIYPASLKAHAQARDAYGRSKYAAEQMLAQEHALHVSLLRLPAVYGTGAFRGKLGVLMRLPAVLRPAALDVLGALKPTVHEARVGDAVLQALRTPAAGPRLITNGQQGNVTYKIGKGIMDLGFALSVGLLFGWLLIGLWAAVRLTSPGPGLFAQERLGRGAVPFTCLKFRTMAQGTAQVGTHEAPASAVTAVGGVLRKLKLDELPQIWNILRGELSLVGPRPGLPVQRELRAAREALDIYAVRPGITGLGQIRGVDMSTPEALAQIDAEYIALRSLPLDLRITLATFIGRGMGDRVRQG